MCPSCLRGSNRTDVLEEDAGSDGDVEAFDPTGHRNGDGPIGELGDIRIEAYALGADQKETGL